MTEEDKIFAGQLFQCNIPELSEKKNRSHTLSRMFSEYAENDPRRDAALSELLNGIGEGSFIQRPATFHYGCHTTIGKHTFINFNLTIQDDAPVTIGDYCNFGPNVTIVTPGHPMLASERRAMHSADGSEVYVCWARPVSIGNDVWLGANVTVCPGVTIGDGCVIGAGSVVTRDIPPNSFAAGVPCKVIREITDADSMNNHPEMLGDYTV